MLDSGLQAIVRRAVANQLQSIHVRDVLVARDEDFDGEDIIRVTVLVDAPASAFEPERLAGLVTHLRDALADEAGEHDFPIVSYVDHRERGRVPA